MDEDLLYELQEYSTHGFDHGRLGSVLERVYQDPEYSNAWLNRLARTVLFKLPEHMNAYITTTDADDEGYTCDEVFLEEDEIYEAILKLHKHPRVKAFPALARSLSDKNERKRVNTLFETIGGRYVEPPNAVSWSQRHAWQHSLDTRVLMDIARTWLNTANEILGNNKTRKGEDKTSYHFTNTILNFKSLDSIDSRKVFREAITPHFKSYAEEKGFKMEWGSLSGKNRNQANGLAR